MTHLWKTYRVDGCRLLVLAVLLPRAVLADAAAEQSAKAGSFFGQYCTQCHGEKKSQGKVTLDDFSFERGTAEKLKSWERLLKALEGGDMPPEEEKKQPTAAERKEIAALLAGELRRPAQQLAGTEPSAAGARRLTNCEYENTMRDLLGVDLRLKQSLPEDPVKPYHFNNTAEFMLMGPEQIERYLECARRALASAIVDPAKPPEIGEFRIRFQAAAIPPEGTREIPLRIVMGESLNVNSSTLRIEPVGTVRLRNSPDAPEICELRGRLENFPLADSTGAMTQLTA